MPARGEAAKLAEDGPWPKTPSGPVLGGLDSEFPQTVRQLGRHPSGLVRCPEPALERGRERVCLCGHHDRCSRGEGRRRRSYSPAPGCRKFSYLSPNCSRNCDAMNVRSIHAL
jgi:hypothetical protein